MNNRARADREIMLWLLIEISNNQNIKIMKYNEFLSRVMSDDETKHEFTNGEKIMYGVLIPIGLVLIMGVVGYMETSCQ